MSDKLDLILSEIQKMNDTSNKRLEQNEIMISSLIKMVGTVSAKTEEISADLKDIKAELKADIADLAKEVRSIKGDIEITFDKTSRNELELLRLKKSIL
jgi:hypothetical protein